MTLSVEERQLTNPGLIRDIFRTVLRLRVLATRRLQFTSGSFELIVFCDISGYAPNIVLNLVATPRGRRYVLTSAEHHHHGRNG